MITIRNAAKTGDSLQSTYKTILDLVGDAEGDGYTAHFKDKIFSLMERVEALNSEFKEVVELCLDEKA